MPMPYTYRHASAEFAAFLADARERLGLDSDNMTYTAVDAVFQVFRRRLTVPQALAFADVLPAVLRAIFLWRWTPGDPAPWSARADLAVEVKAVRPHHNLTPDHAITAVAEALAGQVLPADLDPVLNRIGPEAVAFWAVDPARRRAVTFP